jgi:hypothetical protein
MLKKRVWMGGYGFGRVSVLEVWFVLLLSQGPPALIETQQPQTAAVHILTCIGFKAEGCVVAERINFWLHNCSKQKQRLRVSSVFTLRP